MATLVLALIASTEGVSLDARSATFLGRQASTKAKTLQNPRVTWDYAEHGANWPGLCSTDQRQSPIALPLLDSLPNETRTMWYRYQNWEEPVTLYNDGLSLSVTFHQKVGGIGIGESFTGLDESWSLAQMTIHAPSEHTWAGVHVPLELQLVHTPAKTGAEVAVVSIGFTRGPMDAPNLFLDTLLKNGLPQFKGKEVETNLHYGDALPFNDLLSGSEFFTYEGSASQPPCTPDAVYFVRNQPIDVNPERLEVLLKNIAVTTGIPDGNYRVPQPLNSRAVTRVHAVDASGMETAEQVTRRSMAEGPPTASPSVPLLESDRDVDHEDATTETDEVKMHFWYSDPTGDIVRAQKEKTETQDDILNAYDAKTIREKPDMIIAAMPAVSSAQESVDAATVELTEAQQNIDKANQALILAKEGRDYAEGRTNLTEAEAAYMSAQDEVHAKQTVVDALTTKVSAAKALHADAMGSGHAKVWWAQKTLDRLGSSLPGNGGVEAILPMSYELPTGPYSDPFSQNNAELRSRIRFKGLPKHLTQALGPNHIHVAGTVTVGNTEEQESVIAPDPTGVLSPTDEEPEVVEG